MIEEVKIRLSAELNSKGLDDLRKKLNENRNELNKLARQQEKGSAEHKKYKAEVREINRVMKLSDVELTRLQRSLQREEKAAKDAAKATKQLGDSSKDTAKDVGGLSDVMKVGIAAGATYLASQIGNIIGQFQELATAGANFENLYNAFVKVNGGIDLANEKLELLRKASAGNLDDSKLIEFTNEMNSLGFATDDAAKLLDVAEVMGDNLGKTFDQTTNAFKTFIITGQGRSLKEIGVNIKEVEAKMLEYAGATQEQIDGLSELDQQQLRSSFVLNTYGRSIDDINSKLKGTDDRLASMSTLTANLSNLLGVTLANAFEEVTKDSELFNAELNQTVEGAKQLGKDIGKVANDALSFGSSIIQLANIIRENTPNIVTQVEFMISAFERLAQSQKSATQGQFIPPDLQDMFKSIENFGFASKGTNFLDELNLNFGDKTGTSNTGSKGSDTANTVKEITTEVQDLEKSLIDLNDKLNKSTPNTEQYRQYAEAIAEVTAKIKFLNTAFFDFSGKFPNLELLSSIVNELSSQSIGFNADLTKRNITGAKSDRIDPQTEPESKLKGTIEDVDTIGSGISNIMNTLDLGTNKFVNDLLNGFQQAVEIVKAIQTVNSILGFIPGFASGGTFAGGSPIMVGEKGAEIIFPKNSGYVMNNQDSKKLLNSSISGKSQEVNVFINANMDGLTFLKKNFPNYQNFKKGNRIN